LHYEAGRVPSGGTTLSLLDRETRPFHAEADRGWHRLLHSSDATRDDYVRQLVAIYGFELPFEAACSLTPDLAQAIDVRGRWRCALIAQDLLALGWTADEITNVGRYTLTPFQDAVEALGWMYVIERPTLIHADIREELTSRFVDLARATTYLRAYEGTASKRWAELGIALDRLCNSTKISKRVIDAATTALRSLIEWQDTSGPALRVVS
jgi:heme oxygenase